MNQLSFHSCQKIKQRANFEFTIFIVSSINDRCSAVKKIIKSNSSVCCTFGMALTRASLTMQLTSGVEVFAHVCEQTLDNLSNWQQYPFGHINKTLFFPNMIQVLILFGNFMTNLLLLLLLLNVTPCQRSQSQSHQALGWPLRLAPLRLQTHPECRPMNH